MFFLAGLPPLTQSDMLFSNISAEEFPSNLSKINEKVLAISHEGMVRLLYGCLLVLPNTVVTLDRKAFLSVKNYFYQHQNITTIIKGEGETCPNF